MQKSKKLLLYTATFLFILGTIFVIYRPTLFDFYIGDDFFHIHWASKAAQNPASLLEPYWYHAQPAVTDIAPADRISFYRPLFLTILSLEYMLWHNHAFLFRLANLLTELIAGLMLGILVIALARKCYTDSSISDRKSTLWGFFTAILFVLYPLHSETVNCISARMDPLVTIFCLFSLWCYIQWRNKSDNIPFALSIISAVLAFLTKEMAVALPPIIFTYELLIQQAGNKALSNKHNYWISRLYLSLKSTAPYWLILALYFGLRKIILGKFIGGYPNNMTNAYFIPGWLEGLRSIIIPINPLLIGSHSPIFKAWYIVVLIAIVLTIIATVKTKKYDLKLIIFFIVWFLLSLAPVAKIFPTIMSCATGSRLAYLATVPVCALLTYGLASFSIGNRLAFLSRAIILLFFGLAASILYTNNIAWADAGRLTNQTIQQIKTYYKHISGDPLVYVSGLPIRSDAGITVLIGMFSGLTSQPIMDRDIHNFRRIDSNDPYNSFGFIKQSVAHNDKSIKLLYWDPISRTLNPVTTPANNNFVRQWTGCKLKQILRVPMVNHISEPDFHWLSDGTLELISHRATDTCTILELDLQGTPCWNIDFLALKIQFSQLKNLGIFQGAGLFFTNDISKEYSKEYFRDYFVLDSCRALIKSTSQDQEIIFPLRNLPAWSMGGKCHSIRIVFPSDCNIKIKEVEVPESQTMTPSVYIQPASNSSPGNLLLNKTSGIQFIKYDARQLDGDHIVLEIAQASKFFDLQNSTDTDKFIFIKKESKDLNGEFTVELNDFRTKGQDTYRARLRALDKAGKQVGFPSNSFFIYVDP